MKIALTTTEAQLELANRYEKLLGIRPEITIEANRSTPFNGENHLFHLCSVRSLHWNGDVSPESKVQEIKRLRELCTVTDKLNGKTVSLGLADAKRAIEIPFTDAINYVLRHGSLENICSAF